jgi:uncharacterized protein YdiU (UPF0061 family)
MEGDEALLERLLEILAANRVDFPLFFRRLSNLAPRSGRRCSSA